MKIDKQKLLKYRDYPIKTKQDLNTFFKFYLGVYLADKVVEPGNSCPLDFIWDVYNTAMTSGLTDKAIVNFMAMASRGSQKCSVGSTLCATDKGFVRLDKFKDGNIIGSYPKASKAVGLEDNGIKEIYKLITHNGYFFEGTEDHLVSVYDNGIKYKTLGNLNQSDYVLIGGNGLVNDGDDSDFDLGYLLGVLMGDGCLTTKDVVQIEMQDIGIINKVTDIFRDKFDIACNVRFNHTNNRWRIRFSNAKFKESLSDLGVKFVTAKHKEIPQCVWAGSRNMVSGFLSGYFDTDGYLSWSQGGGAKCAFRWNAASEKLMSDLQILLINFGIKSRRSQANFRASPKSKAAKGVAHTSHNLVVSSPFAYELSKFIRSYSTRPARVKNFLALGKLTPVGLNDDKLPSSKIHKLLDGIRSYYRNHFQYKGLNKVGEKTKTNGYNTMTRKQIKDFLVKYASCSGCNEYKELDKLVNSGFSLEQVKNVANTGRAETVYDITVPENENFLANGIVVHNTLGCAALITALLMHDRNRDIIHMASIAAQANVLFEVWLTKFAARPYMDDVFTKLTMRRTTVKSGRMLTVTHGTMDAVNAHHGGMLIQDEVDLTDPVVFDESKGMLVASKGWYPINVMISSRKYAMGNIQKVLDKYDLDPAFASTIKIHKWGVLEATARCKPERHGEYGTELMVNQDDLIALDYETWKLLSQVEKQKYEKHIGYKNCAQCGIFSFCLGRLIGQSDNPYLTPIDVTVKNFKSESSEFFKSQRLNRKPSTRGLVYGRYESSIHDKTDQEMYEMISCKPKAEMVGLQDLIVLIKSLKMPLYVGMDFGYNEAAACLLTVDSKGTVYVLDEIYTNDVSDREFVLIAFQKWSKFKLNCVFPDIAAASGVKELRKLWDQNCSICLNTNKDRSYGINLVRNRIFKSGTNEPGLYISKSRCNRMRFEFRNYRYKVDVRMDEPIDVIHKRYDHILDALRYAVVMTFGGGTFTASFGEGQAIETISKYMYNGMPSMIVAPTGQDMLNYANKTPIPNPSDSIEPSSDPKEDKPFYFYFED